MTNHTNKTFRPVHFTLAVAAFATLLAPFAPAWIARAEPDSTVDTGPRDERSLEPRFVSSAKPAALTPAASAKDHALAERVSAALRGERKAKTLPRSKQRPTAASSKRAPAWACGAWEELWQGRGSARSCEWR